MFDRQVITVPSVGDYLTVEIAGCGLVVEAMETYGGADNVPTVAFDNQTNQRQPLYPFGKYAKKGGFDRFYIWGTSQSAGDTLYLLISDSPVEQEIKPVFTQDSAQVQAGQTTVLSTTDTAQGLPDSILYEDGTTDAKKAQAALITIPPGSNDVRIGFGAIAPDQSASGYNAHHFTAGDQFRITGFGVLQDLQYISDATGVSGLIEITPEY